MNEHDRLELIEPSERRAYLLGVELWHRCKAWRIDQIVASDHVARRLVCSRATP